MKSTRLKAALLPVRIPDGVSDEPLLESSIVEVVSGDYLAIRALHAPRVAKLPSDAVAAEDNLVTSALAIVATQAGSDPVRLGAVAVSEGKAAVFQLNQARWIATEGACVGSGLVKELLGRANVIGNIRFDPAVQFILYMHGREEAIFWKAELSKV